MTVHRAWVHPATSRAAVFLALGALACGAPPGPTRALSPGAIEGCWQATLEHGGTTATFALEFERDEAGKSATYLSLPDLGVFRVPMGPAGVTPDTVTIGSMTLKWEPRSEELSGTMPPSLVPVHMIPVALRRVGGLEKSVGTVNSVPAAQPVWTFETGGAVWAGVTAGESLVFAGSDDGNLYALDARTGRERWRFATGGAIRARPVILDRSLLVHSDDGILYRIDAANGTREWEAVLEAAPPRRLALGDEGYRFDRRASAPAVSEGRIFIGRANRIHALDARTGRALWSFETDDLVTSTPAVRDGRVYFGGFDGKVRALDAATGREIWSHDTGAPVVDEPALQGPHVIVGSRSYDLLALKAEDGAPVWTYYMWFSWVDSPPRIVDDVVYVGSSDARTLHAIDAGSGALRWKFSTGGWAWAQPAVSEDSVFIGSVGTTDYSMKHEAAFHAVARETGKGIWRYAPAPPEGGGTWGFASSPAIRGDRVIVGGLDGRVYAFAARPGS